MILTINRNMASWYHVYQFDNSSSTFNLRLREDRKWIQLSGNSCRLLNNHLFSRFADDVWGHAKSPPPPPKNIEILFNWRTFMDCIEYIHSLKKTLWMMKKEFRSYLKLNRSGFCRFSVCLLLINKAILEHLPNRLHWCTLKSKPRLS